MKKISNLLMMALLTVGMGLTSCEDILGHWEKPTPVTPAPTPEPTMLETPLTLEAVSGTLTVTIKTNMTTGKTIEYSTDDGATWTEGTPSKGTGTNIDNCANPVTITGSKVLLRGTNATYAGSGNYTKIVCDADCYIYGNVMSLIDKDNFATDATPSLTGDYAFKRLFDGNDHLYSHDTKELLLPATTLTQNCYNGMFRLCTGLTAAPALPATTLADYCYYFMFRGCKGLTAAPALPATSLVESCYNGMFFDCEGLTAAPALPATTLVESCYGSMFSGCTGLTAAPALPATTLAQSCYSYMFNGCTSLTKAPKLPATTLSAYCYDSMFQDCSKLSEAWVKAAFTDGECPAMFKDAATSGGGTLHTTADHMSSWSGAGNYHIGNLAVDGGWTD